MRHLLRRGRLIYNQYRFFLVPSQYHCKSLPKPCSYSYKMEKVVKEWKIFDQTGHSFNFGNYGVLILNRPICISPERFSKLWNDACWRITIDGGTDRVFDFIKEHSLSLPLPNYVTGDFDSIKPETLDYCKENGEITVEKTPDQDLTDFNKAINVLLKACPHKLDSFVGLVEHSGRLDQTFSNINTLSKVPLHGYLLSHSSIAWLLKPGSHRIDIPQHLRDEQEWCGILPFSTAAKVTTKGLKWNLDNDTIEFGGLLSTSNTYDGSPEVYLETDSTVIWTMAYCKN